MAGRRLHLRTQGRDLQTRSVLRCRNELAGRVDMSESGTMRVCVSCGARAPATETDFTLIGSKHAWRCKKVAAEDGALPRLEWYCPSCWKEQRGTQPLKR